MTLILALALAVVSYFGAFAADTYTRDAASMAAQGQGQDLVDLFLVVPLLLVSLFFLRNGSKLWTLLFSGIVSYILYSFVIYCFGVHFNRLFLLYCLTLGASLYLFIIVIHSLNGQAVESWFAEKTPVKATGIFLAVVAAMFYLLWLRDVVPAIITDTTPKSVSDYNLLVNPVHVIDIAIALPGLLITAVLFMKRRRLGYILAPVCLVFIIILAIALAAMVIVVKLKGISEDASIAVIFIVLAAVSFAFLYSFLKRVKA